MFFKKPLLTGIVPGGFKAPVIYCFPLNGQFNSLYPWTVQFQQYHFFFPQTGEIIFVTYSTIFWLQKTIVFVLALENLLLVGLE